MQNVFERICAEEQTEGKALSDYEPYQLAAYMLRNYPGDPIGALKLYKDNLDVGVVLYSITRTLLEGSRRVKRDEML